MGRCLVHVDDLSALLHVHQQLPEELNTGPGLLFHSLVPIAELEGGPPSDDIMLFVNVEKLSSGDL